jgi:hypothetical protein
VPSGSFFFVSMDSTGTSALASQAAQRGDIANLSITLVRVGVSGAQFLTQRAAAKAGLIEQGGGGIATDVNAVLQQPLRQPQRLEVGPAHTLTGPTAGALSL